MEDFEQRWRKVEALLHERFGKTPDLQGLLFLIGINELGQAPEKPFTKEQKQDLMHIAVCTLLSQLGHYSFIGRDDDGWPHYTEILPVTAGGVAGQEQLLKECAVRYFEL